MTAASTIPARKLAELSHRAHRGDADALGKLRAWIEASPSEARHAARRSWKLAAILNDLASERAQP